jgi:hypothetical protein
VRLLAAALVLMIPDRAQSQARLVPGILIWGRIRAGSVVLEPALQYEAAARLPSRPGEHRVRGLDAAGVELFSFGFAGELVMPEGDSSAELHFSFFVPLDPAALGRLHRIELKSPQGAAVRESSMPPGVSLAAQGRDPKLRAVRQTDGVRVTWDSEAYPLALVRSAANGLTLSMARGGNVHVLTQSTELEILLSDGVKTRIEHVTAP